MSTYLEVLQRGPSDVSIIGARSGSTTAHLIEAWLAERIDVVRFEERAGTGVFHVHYDDGIACPGRFVRSLRAKIYTINRVAEEPFEITPVHSLTGRVRLRVTGIHERQLATLAGRAAGIPGVKHTQHIPGGRTVLVVYDPQKVTEEIIVSTLSNTDAAELAREWTEPASVRWGGALAGTWTLFLCLTRAISFPWLALGVALNTLRPLTRSLGALGDGEISIDLLDVIATFAALATGRPITAAFVIWMVGIGDLLLDISAVHARSALATLIRRKEPDALRLLPGGQVEMVLVGDLKTGDRLMVQTGRGMPADGKVVSGVAEVDGKALTGESELVPKKEGDAVLASSIVVDGQIVVEVEHAGMNTEVGKIERILSSVGMKPLTLQRDALQVASKLVLPTLGVGSLAGLLSSDWNRTVSVLITDFGTGIRIAVPTSALTAMTLAARECVLFKGAQYFERLSKTDVIIFDKTGTLTTGVPEVVEVITAKGMTESTLMTLCASAEARHEHPVAKALKAYAEKKHYELSEPDTESEEYEVGMGLSVLVGNRRVQIGRATWMENQRLKINPAFRTHLARFKKNFCSSLCVAIDNEVVGLIAYSDGIRPESADMVKRLQANGRRKIVLLSGDSSVVVKNLAQSIGIDEAVGGLLPEQKAEYLKGLQAQGRVVAMVGDGINDAPALALADVGISMAGSTDVALETADVVLLDGGLAQLDRAFQISDEAMGSVRQNLGIIIAPNAIAIFLGAFGFIGPPMAAIINNGATFLAVAVGTIPLLWRRPEALRPEALPAPVREKPTRERSSKPEKLPDEAAPISNQSLHRTVAGRRKG
ncbi:MAG TPA: heavy metal translocating P-type ATPase [Candidatus Polarisedimenticolia bacterium]|nr:heavy metal translocating P-type ATPase [Candidatus Polarisedimenticolia bacterium]